MPLRSYLARIVIAAAAAASIATSQIWWTLEEAVSLEPAALDDGAPAIMYAIQATLDTGEGAPSDARGGEVQVTLELSARTDAGAQPAVVDVELRSATGEGEVATEFFLLPAGSRATRHLSLVPWSGCPSPSCTEDFTLTLRRRTAAGDPAVEVTGSVLARYSAPESRDPPPGAGIVLDVTNLGPVP